MQGVAEVLVALVVGPLLLWGVLVLVLAVQARLLGLDRNGSGVGPHR